jgi:hypothetical protein
MSGPTCRRCGEEIHSWQYSPEPGVCSDCYVIDDRARFAPVRPTAAEALILSDHELKEITDRVARAFAGQLNEENI